MTAHDWLAGEQLAFNINEALRLERFGLTTLNYLDKLLVSPSVIHAFDTIPCGASLSLAYKVSIASLLDDLFAVFTNLNSALNIV